MTDREKTLAREDAMGEGTDSRTAMDERAGSERFRFEETNLMSDNPEAHFCHAEISIDKADGGTHHCAVIVYGESLNAARRAKLIVRACNSHEALVSALKEFGRHEEGCRAMWCATCRAIEDVHCDRGEMCGCEYAHHAFQSQVCSCGFAAALALAEGK